MIPIEVDEITPAWLSEVLGVDVWAVWVLDAHSGTTGRARVAVETGDEGVLPPSLFVKLAPFDERQRRFVDAVGLGPAEARFYAELGREVPVRVPTALHAETDGDRYVMVLEDLVASGCRFPRLQDDDVAELVGRIVDELAALHAQYWDAPALHAERAWTRRGAAPRVRRRRPVHPARPRPLRRRPAARVPAHRRALRRARRPRSPSST